MKYFVTCVEQLALAAEQLDRLSPEYARLALMLTDNVAELVLKRHVNLLDLRSGGVLAATADQPLLRRATRAPFPKLVDRALAAGSIARDIGQFARWAHAYRNEVYHRGLLHDRVVHALAHTYHDIVSEWLGSLEGYGFDTLDRFGSTREFSETFTRFVPEVRRFLGSPTPAVGQRLALSKGALVEPLGRALAANAAITLASLRDDLDYLLRIGCGSDDESAVLAAYSELRRDEFSEHTVDAAWWSDEAIMARHDLFAFAASVRRYQNWCERAQQLAALPAPAALEAHEMLRREATPVASIVAAAVYCLGATTYGLPMPGDEW